MLYYRFLLFSIPSGPFHTITSTTTAYLLTPSIFPNPRLVGHTRQSTEMREKLVYLSMLGVLARFNFQKPASEITPAVGMGCKMRCDFKVITDRAGHVKVHDLVLEPRHERAVDAR